MPLNLSIRGLLPRIVDWIASIELAGGVGTTGPVAQVPSTVVPKGGARISSSTVVRYNAVDAWDRIVHAVVDHDSGGFYDAAHPGRLTVPANVTKVRLSASMDVAASDAIEVPNLFSFSKNGLVGATRGIGRVNLDAGSTSGMVISDVLDVVPGDWFEHVYRASTQFDMAVANAGAWFAVEVVERSDSGVTTDLRLGYLSDVVALDPKADDVLTWDPNVLKYMPKPQRLAPLSGAHPGLPFVGAMLSFDDDPANQIGHGVSPAWPVTVYDRGDWTSDVLPGTFVVPPGVTMVEVGCHLIPAGGTLPPNNVCHLTFSKNGSFAFRGNARAGRVIYANDPTFIDIASPPLAVVAGDRIQVIPEYQSMGDHMLVDSNSYFWIRAIEIAEAA